MTSAMQPRPTTVPSITKTSVPWAKALTINLPSVREEVDLLGYLVVLQPPIETFNEALRFGVGVFVPAGISRDLLRNLRQLNALGSYDAANHAGQRVQMACTVACMFARTKLAKRGYDCLESFLPSAMGISPLYKL